MTTQNDNQIATRQIVTREMIYHNEQGKAFHGFLALPSKTDEPVPAVVVAPEWWGVSEHPKRAAKKLAQAGYAALAIDVYGEGKTTTQATEANSHMQALLEDQGEMLACATLGFESLKDLSEVNGEKIAAIGFCLGGKIVLDMARSGLDLKAVATFHGNPTPYQKAKAGDIKAEILVAHGAKDSMVSMAGIEALEAELEDAGANYTVDIYEHAKHGFSNPVVDERAKENDIDLAYNAEAAEQSWQRMLNLFARVLA